MYGVKLVKRKRSETFEVPKTSKQANEEKC